MKETSNSRFLQIDALARLQNMRLSFNRVVEGPYAGRHESVQRGGAVEFVDFRQYSPGEDLRRLDWKALARFRKPFVRVYADETNLICTLLVDSSASMLYEGQGRKTVSKLDYARYLAAAISYLIVHDRDQVALALAAGGLDSYLPPGGTYSHLHQLCDALETVETKPDTGLADALGSLFRMVRQRGVLIVFSDFLVEDYEAVFAALRLFQHVHFEVVLVHIVHPEEQTLPTGPAYRFVDLETAGVVRCSPADIKQAYEDAFAAHLERVAAMASSGGFVYRFASTAVPYVMTLKDMLVERRG
jgi:uncharacterized protein (DUF58 family)